MRTPWQVTDRQSSDIRSSSSLAVPKLLEAYIDAVRRGSKNQVRIVLYCCGIVCYVITHDMV